GYTVASIPSNCRTLLRPSAAPEAESWLALERAGVGRLDHLAIGVPLDQVGGSVALAVHPALDRPPIAIDPERAVQLIGARPVLERHPRRAARHPPPDIVRRGL